MTDVLVKERPKERIGIRGMFRLQIIDPEGTIAGDSGWIKNQVVNLGFNDYLCQLLGGMGGSKQVSYIALGTGGAPGAADTSLTGEVTGRASLTAATSSTSKKLRCTATFSSSDSFVTATRNLSNIALVNTSAGGTIFCGNAYASSSCATNQNVNCTYDIDFS